MLYSRWFGPIHASLIVGLYGVIFLTWKSSVQPLPSSTYWQLLNILSSLYCNCCLCHDDLYFLAVQVFPQNPECPFPPQGVRSAAWLALARRIRAAVGLQPSWAQTFRCLMCFQSLSMFPFPWGKCVHTGPLVKGEVKQSCPENCLWIYKTIAKANSARRAQPAWDNQGTMKTSHILPADLQRETRLCALKFLWAFKCSIGWRVHWICKLNKCSISVSPRAVELEVHNSQCFPMQMCEPHPSRVRPFSQECSGAGPICVKNVSIAFIVGTQISISCVVHV